MKQVFAGKLVRGGSRRSAMNRRAAVFFAFCAAAFTALYLRVGYLSQSPGLLQTARQQSRYTLTISRSRGGIYDCRMQPLVNNCEETVQAVLPSPENLTQVLEAVPFSRRAEVSAQIKAGKPFLLRGAEPVCAEGVHPFSVFRRSSDRQLAAHIVGYTGDGGQGVTGIEKSWDAFLEDASVEQKAVYTLDGLGHSMPGIPPEIRAEEASRAGVVLSIDENIQKVVENAGFAGLAKGAIVVMDPYTGEIRASASFPSYTRSTLSEAVRDTDNAPMINRALLSYSVGSTFKVVTAAAALEAGLPMTEPYCCTGQIDVSGQVFRCHDRRGHGEVDMVEAMKKSCNPYFIQLGLRVGGEKLLEMTERFGFGRKIPLSAGMAAAAGALPSPEELRNPAAAANLSFGQGVLTASPVQISRMMAAAVNGGMLVTPRLVLGTTADGQTLTRSPDTPAVRILSPDVAAQLQSFLIHCVMVEEGQNALPPNASAGGKTATAQTGRFDENGKELEHGWFSGFYPAVNPRYVITVLAEDSGFGNGTAAPVFARIAGELESHGW